MSHPEPALADSPSADDRVAAGLRGIGPVGLLALLVIFAAASVSPWLAAVFILLWARLSRTPWSAIGYVRPPSWPRTVILAVVLGAAFKLFLKAVIMPLLGADPINRTYHDLVGNTAALPPMFFAILAGAGFGEETFFRGYLFERLRKLLGDSARARAIIVLVTAALFGVAHYQDQGIPGVQQATIVGLVFGALYARSGSLPGLMIAHAAFDFTALFLIYYDLEARVAHWIFR